MAQTAASASSLVSIMGTTIPYAPASRYFMMIEGSFHGTRTKGIVSVVEIA